MTTKPSLSVVRPDDTPTPEGAHALHQLQQALTTASCTLIQVKDYMIDEGHDAYEPVQLVVDALCDIGDQLLDLIKAQPGGAA